MEYMQPCPINFFGGGEIAGVLPNLATDGYLREAVGNTGVFFYPQQRQNMYYSGTERIWETGTEMKDDHILNSAL